MWVEKAFAFGRSSLLPTDQLLGYGFDIKIWEVDCWEIYD